MPRYAVTTMIPSRAGFVWWPAEIDEPTIDDVWSRLKADGGIKLVKIETYRTPGGELVARARTPMVIGLGMVGTITPLHLEVIEEPAAA